MRFVLLAPNTRTFLLSHCLARIPSRRRLLTIRSHGQRRFSLATGSTSVQMTRSPPVEPEAERSIEPYDRSTKEM